MYVFCIVVLLELRYVCVEGGVGFWFVKKVVKLVIEMVGMYVFDLLLLREVCRMFVIGCKWLFVKICIIV